ncbi:MAG: YCF48-related protein, partial [Candidatus Margulisbacteria bacterium]|nr:YCF48-related protein [Candidatus Margulisiibacteriota bacterium]
LSFIIVFVIAGCEEATILPTTTTLSTTTTIDYHQAVGWTVGEIAGGYGLILHTTNGGAAWVRQGTSQEVTDAVLYSVCALDNDNVWIVGTKTDGSGIILRTTDGGNSWSRQSVADGLLKLSALDTNTAWASGANAAIYKTTNGGQSWVKKNDSHVPNVQIQALYALDADTVWAGGTAINGYATIVKTNNGGASWVRQGNSSFEVTEQNLIDIYALDENNVWAVGGNYMIIKSTDGGDHWVSQHQNVLGDCNGIFPLDINTAWIAQDYGNILHTTDGGNNWVDQLGSSSGFGGYFLLMPRALNKDVCWIVGTSAFGRPAGVILRTTDGGVSWEAQSMPEQVGLWGLSFVGCR